MAKINIFWFRRDLRLDDNAGLYHALSDELPVLPVFIFDKNILDDLEDKDDARITFIHEHISKMNDDLKSKGTTLLVKYGKPEDIWKELIEEYDISKVYTNRDYEPYARERDEAIEKLLDKKDIEFKTFKDHVILEKSEVVKDDGDPYVVFTPYSKQWHKTVTKKDYETYTSALRFDNFAQVRFEKPISLDEMGFEESSIKVPSDNLTEHTLKNYADSRDFPAENGTSRLGVHLRFGTVSIRKIAEQAKGTSRTFLNELIWREFYQMILWHFPKVVDNNFRSKYDQVKWRNNEKEFDAWCKGETGYPIVDAGMRQLNKTGYMHNRVRMIVASFLTKHLLIDWRWGEAYFAKKLLDYELASNNGGWQWAAGTGVDAAPYFRIFNPETQIKKFDPDHKYIKEWVPEYEDSSYPEPIVEHKKGRERALDAFKKALD